MYGGVENVIQKGIENGIIPETLAGYVQENVVVFDLETLEQQDVHLDTKIQIDGVLKVVSIGVASTLPLPERYFERSSSLPESAGVLVSEFMEHLFELEELFYQTVPDELKNIEDDDELKNIEEDKESYEIESDRKSLKDQLRNMCVMPVLGYNSGKHLI